MNLKKKMINVAVASSLLAIISGANAQALRVGNQGDALSLDPHSLNESLQLSVTGNVYEGLTGRGKNLELTPALATSWKQTSPNVWRFELRKGVKFHDGKDFTADDVLFTLARAAGDGSDMKSYTNEIKESRKINDFTVEIETKAPFPIFPETLSSLFIMSKKWAEENQAMKPVDRQWHWPVSHP